jgi:hypothetical protein
MLLPLSSAHLILLSSKMSNLWINSAVNGRPGLNSLFLPCEASYLWRHKLPRLEISIITSKFSCSSALNRQSGSSLPSLNHEYEPLRLKNKSADNLRAQLDISIPPFDFRYLQPIGGMHNKLVCDSEEDDLSFRMPIWPQTGVLGVATSSVEDPNAGAWRPIIWEQDEVDLWEWNTISRR